MVNKTNLYAPITEEQLKELDRQAEEREKMNNNNEEVKVNETLESDYEKTFDEIIDEILGSSDEDGGDKDNDEFEKMMKEMEELKVSKCVDNRVEEVDNTQTYMFSGNAHLNLINGSFFESGLGDGYREVTQIKTSNGLLIDGSFNTSEIQIDKHPKSFKMGKIVFNDRQKTDNLIVANAGLCGEFDASVVSIKDNSYIDITLDISEKTKCAYLLIDTRFDKVCGKIRLTEKFYNQMPEKNKTLLSNLKDNKHIQITVEDIPFAEYSIPTYQSLDYVYAEMIEDLNLE